MKKFLLISGIFLFLAAAPVSADWKNHGAYVSSQAKLKQGGAVVSAAAKSDISKLASESLLGKKSEASPAPEASPSPSPSAKLEIGALIEILNNLIKSLQNLMTN